MEEKKLSIVIDWKDDQNPIFVEIEDHDGRSINIGTIVKRGDGLTAIKITYNDFVRALKIPE